MGMQRKALHVLQDQHSDLLSLLAQQEVELAVFKSALERRVGAAGRHATQLDAQQQVKNLYGVYTEFRSSSEEAEFADGLVYSE
jgi:hypothetical protein